MSTETLQIALTYLAGLFWSTAILITQPSLALFVAFFLLLMLIVTTGSLLTLIHRSLHKQETLLPRRPLANLGTYLGGTLCYAILLIEAVERLV